jgi:hypothetical protein
MATTIKNQPGMDGEDGAEVSDLDKQFIERKGPFETAPKITDAFLLYLEAQRNGASEAGDEADNQTML